MSRAAVCVLALAGCNQIFGLDPTTEVDAPLPPDVFVAETGTVKITRKRVDVAATAPGAPTVDPEPITNARIRAGVVTGQLIDLQADPEDGSRFLVPSVVLEEPSRLEVSLADGSPPVEIAWPEDAKDVTLVVPEIGHRGGDELAPNEQWAITLVNGPDSVPRKAVISTGAWLSWTGGFDDNTLDVLYGAATAHSDARVRPTGAAGDYNIAFELANDSNCPQRPVGYGVFEAPGLGGSMTMTSNAWISGPGKTTTLSVTWPTFTEWTDAGTMLDDLASGVPDRTFVLGHALRPDLVTRAWRIGPLTSTRIEGPGVVPVLACNPESTGPWSFTPVEELEATYGEIAYGRVAWTRDVLGPAGPKADTGYEIVAPVVGGAVSPRSATLARGVAFPVTRLSAADPSTDVFIELCGNEVCLPLTADGVEPPRSSDTDVRFTIEGGKAIDFWSITLVRVLPTSLVPLRVFLTQTPLPPPQPEPPIDAPTQMPPTRYEASFDLSDSVRYPAGTYLFIIRGHLGWPSARTGNFETHQLPYQISTTSTHTFQLP